MFIMWSAVFAGHGVRTDARLVGAARHQLRAAASLLAGGAPAAPAAAATAAGAPAATAAVSSAAGLQQAGSCR